MPTSNEPYCGHCGYQLTGLVNSSRCPECGKPLVEVLTRPQQGMRLGRRYRSAVSVFGLPLVHIASGPWEDERRGRARGIIAIGDIATGVLAIGGFARGVFALGGMAIGLFAFGGLGLGLLAAYGGLAVGGVATGGGAIGIVAQGGFAMGYLVEGGAAVGYIGRAGGGAGPYVVTAARSSPEARQRLAEYAWLIGSGSTANPIAAARVVLSVTAAAAVVACIIVGLGYFLTRREEPPYDH